MRIRLIAVGRKMPAWVQDGYADYAKRLPRECALELVELAPGMRSKKDDPARAKADEGQRMLAKLADDDWVVALDERGRNWSSPQLAKKLGVWMDSGRNVALLIGGADGLHSDVLARADQSWSMSAAVYPHALVRVMVAEQLYRAWALRSGHPYHRE
ncbi:23S rRNA (pseudouridine(1915)-N(3))-methyltransferase RlmH [bacterium]|nr:23S rRNA (pseudouridine(1915)-N(3))-methyltransferase RlmH [bacterium]